MSRIFLIICLLCASCAKNAEKEKLSQQTVQINLNAEPASLDPRTARDSIGMIVLRMLFEGLTRTSLTGKVELALADKMEISEDGLTYVFHLQDSFWSDGSPLTSYDFAFAWKSILDPQFPTDVAYYFYPIKNAKKAKSGEVSIEEIGIRTPSSRILIVELEQPTPYFLELLSMSPFCPVSEKTALSNANWSQETNHFISNGPFVMKSWKHTDQILLSKNPYYWDAKNVQLNQIDLIVASEDTGLRMFEEGKVDWAGSPLGIIPFDAITHLKREKKLHISPFLATCFFRVNTCEKIKERKNPLSNIYFRRALALSLDRTAIVEHLLQGGQKSAKGLVPPEMDLRKEGYFAENQIDEAQKCLQKAKEELRSSWEPIVISYFNNERYTAIAQAVQKQWEDKLQIKVEIEAIEPKIYFQRISKSEFQLATGSWTADFNDPINFLEVFKYKDNGTNNTGWENSQYIDLLNRSQLCKDSEERKQLLREAESILMNELPLIPIYHFALNYLKRDELKDVYLSPLGQLDFRWAYWELDQPSFQKR